MFLRWQRRLPLSTVCLPNMSDSRCGAIDKFYLDRSPHADGNHIESGDILMAWLTPDRRKSPLFICGSMVLLVATGGVIALTWPAAAVPPTLAERLAAALPMLVLILMIATLFRIFDTPGALDPLAGAESRRFRANRQVLQNSIEQFAIFAPSVLSLAAVADDRTWLFVPAMVLLFVIGRLLFWVGYHFGGNWRAPGFNMSFSATLVAPVVSFYQAF